MAVNSSSRVNLVTMALLMSSSVRRRSWLLLSASPACFRSELGAGPCSENSKQRKSLFAEHPRFVIDNNQMAQNISRFIEQRNPGVALCTQHHQAFILRKKHLQALRIGACIALNHGLARRAGKRKLDIVPKSSPCQKANIRTFFLVSSVHSATKEYFTWSACAKCFTNERKNSWPVLPAVPSVMCRAFLQSACGR